MCKLDLNRSDTAIQKAIQKDLAKMRKSHKIPPPKNAGKEKYLDYLRQLGAFRLIKQYPSIEAATDDNGTYYTDRESWATAQEDTGTRIKKLFGLSY